MDLKKALYERHSVRSYTDQKIEGETERLLRQAIAEVNAESGFHFQLCLNEPEAFNAGNTKYGFFKNCRNYIAAVGDSRRQEDCGYYGQRLVLIAQALGLNTCWVALTYKKGKAVYECRKGKKLIIVIALGYGATPGVSRKTKGFSQLCDVPEARMPEWFRAGMEGAQLAPTAVNQQRFRFSLSGNEVSAVPLWSPFGLTKMDLGIVKYNFEIAAGKENFLWAEK